MILLILSIAMGQPLDMIEAFKNRHMKIKSMHSAPKEVVAQLELLWRRRYWRYCEHTVRKL